MTLVMTQNRIDELEEYKTTGNAVAYYTALASWGSEYAELALGVVQNNTVAGRTANYYMAAYAEQHSITFNSTIQTQINIDLMEADFGAREASFNNNNTGELLGQDIEQYHGDTLDPYGLPLESWTPFVGKEHYGTSFRDDALFNDSGWSQTLNLLIDHTLFPVTNPVQSTDPEYTSWLAGVYKAGLQAIADEAATNGLMAVTDYTITAGLTLLQLERLADVSLAKWESLIESFQNASEQLLGTAADVIHTLNNWFANPFPFGDPLTLDMDRDGNVDLRGLESGLVFDPDEDDFLERVGWVKAEDGMLARDLNSDGMITDQAELFGNTTTGGFAMLSALDSNSDDVINNLDTNWNTLLVWQDANQDAIGQSNELVTLDTAGIVSISLDTIAEMFVVAGNLITNYATITWDDTGTSYAWDVNLAIDDFFTKYNGEYELNPEVLFLPTARGYGSLTDLHIAMSENEDLLEKVKDFSELSLTDYRGVQKAVLDILVDWSGADELGEHSDYTQYLTLPSEYIYLMDVLRGLSHVNHTGNEIVGMFLDKYIQMIASRLLVETHFKDVLPNLSYNINADKFEGSVDYEIFVDKMLELAPTVIDQSTLYWRDMISLLNEIGANLGTSESVYKTFVIDAMDENDVPFTYDQLQDMNEFSSPDHGNYFRNVTDGEGQFYSLAQSSSYSGQSSSTSGDDIIIGLPGGETSVTIHGGVILNAGDGNDTVYGSLFNDVIFGGSGQNTIYGYEGSDEIDVGGSDTVYGGNHNDLITVVTAGVTTTLHGDDGDDTITGSTGVDTIYGGAGEDTINGSGGQDSLYGGDGDDWVKGVNAAVIYGDAGNDTLIGGGVSNQALYGGDGNDILSFDPVTNRLAEIYQYGGNGDDTLNIVSAINYLDGGDGDDLYNWTITGSTNEPFGVFITDSSGFDRLDINGQNLPMSLDKVGDDLFIYFNDYTLTIEGQFSNPSDLVIDEIWHDWSSTLIDLYTWTPTSGSTITGTNSGESLLGTGYSDFIYGLNGNDTLNGLSGHDYLEGGAGEDTLNGGGQNDILVGGLGFDSLRGGAGNDTYRFQVGDGQDTITQESYTESYNDVIEFTDGTTWDDLNFGLSGLGLLIYYGSTDYITIQNQYTSVSGGVAVISQTAIEEASFSDESSYNLTTGVGVHSVGGGTSINQTYTSIPEYVYASTQADTLYMLAGNDTVYARAGNDYIDGGDSHDWLYGEDGDDTLLGGDGNDRLYGGNNIDTLDGGSGDDRLEGGAGIDTMSGGLGNDVYVVDSLSDVVTENASEGTDTVETALNNYTLAANIENLILTGSSHYSGTGNSLDNIIIGSWGNNTLTGDAGNDYIDGDAGNDSMIGGTGDDTYIVNTTNDTVTESVDEGTDSIQSSVTFTLSSNVENLTLTASANINGIGNGLNNIITGNSGNNTLTGNAGDDTLNGGAGSDTLNAGVDNDTAVYIYSENTSATDTYRGNEGTDRLDLYFLSSELTETIKADILTYRNYINDVANINISAASGAEYQFTSFGLNAGRFESYKLFVDSIEVVPVVDGKADSFVAGSEVVYNGNLLADNGNGIDIGFMDTLYAAAGTYSTTQGGTIVISSNGAFTYTSATSFVGTDTFTYTVNDGYDTSDTALATFNVLATTSGTSGNNTLNGSGSDNYINALSGNDTINASLGADVLDGGDGTDTVTYAGYGATSGITVDFRGATHKVTKHNGSVDILIGIEKIYATSYDDTIYATDNVIYSGTSGIYYAGAGNDTLYGGLVADALHAESGNDILYGGDGNNTLVGGSGNDEIYGGAGDDALVSGSGTDIIDGGSGIDEFDLYQGNQSANVNLNTGVVSNDGFGDADTIANVEDIYGTSHADMITGSAANNILDGNSGNDTIYGLSGNDTLYGKDGDDTLYGGDGDDLLEGGNNNDTLYGDSGNDTLKGGTGNDTYFVDSTSDIINENLNSGTDGVQSSVTYTIATNVENLALTGTSAINGTGNSLANIISGNSGDNTLNGNGGDDTLYGGDGLDTLTGSSGADTFVFEVVSAFNNIDTISDFNTGQSDKLDISDLLTGYTPGTSDINDFMSLTVAGSNTTVLVDRDGTGGTYSSQSIASLTGVTGLDVDDLLSNGNLIVS